MIPLGASLRSYDRKAVSNVVSTNTGLTTRTQQHLRDEVDINTIVRRFGITREMPSGIPGGVYGDFTGVEDFESALAAISRARDGFMALPPEVRERFDNDPGQLIEFARGATEEQLRSLVPVAPVAPPVAPVAPVAAVPPVPAAVPPVAPPGVKPGGV